MAAKRRMMTLNAISLYDDLGDSESSSATKPSAKTDGEKSEPDAEASNRKRLRSEEGDKNSQGDDKNTIKSKAGDAADNQTENNSGVGTVSLLSVCGWRKGEREEMQDAHVLEDHYDIITGDIKACALYGIFDGHAGKRAAQFSSQRMPTILKDKLSACKNVAELENSLKRIFVDVYRQTDEQFLMMARKVRPTWKDGTTATTVLIFNTIVYCANIGDSRAVVCREKSDGSVVALQLTSDHSPLQFDERMRIQKAGGTVKDGRIMGILEVSRSIGDGQFKAHGVTCVPDVKKFSITSEDRFILIACDGLWKTFSNQEAVEYVLKKSKQSVKTENTNESEESLIDARYVQWERTAGEIAAESVRKGCGDNVSVIIVVLNDRNNSSRSLS